MRGSNIRPLRTVYVGSDLRDAHHTIGTSNRRARHPPASRLWHLLHPCHATRAMSAIWTPNPQQAADSHLSRFHARMRAAYGDEVVGSDYPQLHAWSVRERATFWRELWGSCEVMASPAVQGAEPDVPTGVHLDEMAPPSSDGGPQWFPNARLNYAEHLVRYRDDRHALVAWTERGCTRRWTYAELYADVCRVASGLRALGVQKGDCVAAFMPNVAETVIAMIATTAIGATWTSCSPDFGQKGVLDRFGQVAPKVLLTTDWYQ